MPKRLDSTTITVFLVLTLCATAIVAILLLVLYGPDSRDVMPVVAIIIGFVGTTTTAVFAFLRANEAAERTHIALHEAREIKTIVENSTSAQPPKED